MDKYRDWIAANCPGPYGRCAEYTTAMVAAFPELRRVRGFYYDVDWGEREHWWCIAPDGEIIDPTADQFPTKGDGHYDQWDDSQPEPTGMCPNCGGYCYGGGTCCSDECGRAYAAYCMNPN